jgi:folate-binding protein YgfZ
MSVQITADPYHAAHTSAVIIDRSDRARLEVSGPDRAKFLHNLTTQEVKRLSEGRGAEAFVTSPQGKTLGYVTLLAGSDRVLVRADPGGTGGILPHLVKYGVFDDVIVDEVSVGTFEIHVAGPKFEEIVERAYAGAAELPETGELRHRVVPLAAGMLWLVRESPLGVPGLTLIGRRGAAGAVGDILRSAGEGLNLVGLDPETAEALRIEAGVPVFGRDVTPDNLPQEVGRDDQAISFVKGCYLGQETVARIDAVGHVNKQLCGLFLDGGRADVPKPGTPIEVDGKSVGTVTSAAFSPGAGRPIALGYVKMAHARPGERASIARIPAQVVGLPFPKA